jgi:osmotically inducible protein OsmC
MMSTRTVRAVWTGPLETGFGQLELGDLKVGVVELTNSTPGTHQASFPTPTDQKTETNSAHELIAAATPDELIAASYSASFILHLLTAITEAGATPINLEVWADASIAPDAWDAPDRPGISLVVHAEARSLDAQTFATLAAAATTNCQIGKTLYGVEINLATTLA